MATVKFVMHRRQFQEQVLYSPQLGKALGDALGAAAGGTENVEVSDSDNSKGKGRVRARVYSSAPNALDDEAQTGRLSGILGRVRL